MELHIDVVNISVKTTKPFKLHCKAEASGSGEIRTETSSRNLTGNNSENSLQSQSHQSSLLPKFHFLFKEPSPNVVALLFTATTGNSDGEVGRCLFPITFRGSAPTNISPLDLAAADIIKQTQMAILTTEVDGMAINKMVGKVWFKVNSRKPVPKPKLKARQSILDLKIVQEQMHLVTSPVTPSVSDLVARESEASCLAPVPIDRPTVTVVFHCIRRSSNDRHASGNLLPIACIGKNLGIRNDTLFKESDSGGTTVTSVLKTIALKCRNKDEFVELHMAESDSLLFSAAHQVCSLVPFKHYNWEYNWRWTSEPSEFSPSRSQNTREPSIIISVVHKPSSLDYLDYEGLEVLVHGVKPNMPLENKNIVLCTRFVCNHRSSERLQGGDSISDDEVQISVIRYKSAATVMTVPAYHFFQDETYFESKRSDCKLLITLYAADDSNSHLWWETQEIASATLSIPLGLQKVLRSPENQMGVYWELTSEDLTSTQPLTAHRPVTCKISGVIRWKQKQMQFITSEIEAQLKHLPAYSDLVFTEATTAMSSANTSPAQSVRVPLLEVGPQPQVDTLAVYGTSSRQENSQVLEEYMSAMRKMGMDIITLRQENRVLQEEKEQLERHMRDVAMASTDNRSELESLSKTDLIQKMLEISRHLASETETRTSCQKRVRELQNKLIEKNDREVEFVALQEAHAAQQKLVQELQTKVEKYRKCYDTCEQQETVINQLESLLAHQGHSDTLSALSKENARLRATLKDYQRMDPHKGTNRDVLQEKEETITSLSAELSRVTEKCRHLEERIASNPSKQSQDGPSTFHEQSSRVAELEGKLKVATAREDVLVSELARNWVQEKAQYEVKLAELKSKVQFLERRMTKDHQEGGSRRSDDSRHDDSVSQGRSHLPQSQPSSQTRGPTHHSRATTDTRLISF